MHRESNLIIAQEDATLFSLLHFCRQLYMFRVLTPIISSSYICNYSFWHWSTAIVVYIFKNTAFNHPPILYIYISYPSMLVTFNIASLEFASCVILTQRSTECTSVARHSSQHNITQHDMLPQHPTCKTKLFFDYFKCGFSKDYTAP